MTADNLVKTQNVYNFFDYNQQLNPIKNDMRTSYMRSHQNYLQNDTIGPPAKTEENPCKILSNKEIRYDYKTESQQQYYPKSAWEIESKADRAMQSNRPQFIHRVHETMFQYPPKPIKTKSSYFRDYDPKRVNSGDKILPINHLCPKPSSPSIAIWTTHEGHYKYVDPYATTNVLTYPPYTVDQQNGIARKDNITVWDWFQYPKARGFGLEFYPTKQKSIKEPMANKIPFALVTREKLIPNSMEFVPNRGMTSEKQSEFSWPIENKFEPNIYNVKPLQIPSNLQTGSTEYSMYGSADRIEKFVDQGLK